MAVRASIPNRRGKMRPHKRRRDGEFCCLSASRAARSTRSTVCVEHRGMAELGSGVVGCAKKRRRRRSKAKKIRLCRKTVPTSRRRRRSARCRSTSTRRSNLPLGPVMRAWARMGISQMQTPPQARPRTRTRRQGQIANDVTVIIPCRDVVEGSTGTDGSQRYLSDAVSVAESRP